MPGTWIPCSDRKRSTRLLRTRSRLPRLPRRRLFSTQKFAPVHVWSVFQSKDPTLPAFTPISITYAHRQGASLGEADALGCFSTPFFMQEELRKHAMASPAPKTSNAVALGRGDTPRSTRKAVRTKDYCRSCAAKYEVIYVLCK